MTSTTSAISPQLKTNTSGLWITALTIWHVLLGVALLFGTFSALARQQLFVINLAGTDPAIRVIAALLVALPGVLSLLTAFLVIRRQRQGRALAILLNYVGFVLALVVALQALDVFNGISALADNIEKSAVPALGMALLVVLYFQIGRLPEQLQAQARTAGLIILAVSGVLLALQLGVLTGIVGAFSRLGPALPYLALAVVFGAFGWSVFRPAAAASFGETLATREAIMGLLFLSPNLLGFLIFFAVPLIISLFLSFTQYELFTAPEWRGLSNYQQILGLSVSVIDSTQTPAMPATYQEIGRISLFGRSLVIGGSDPTFWIALRNTVSWVILIIPLSIIPALGLAVLVNSKIKGVGFFRPLFFLPVVAGVVGVSLIWSWLFNPEIGSFNSLISSFVETVNRLTGQSLLSDPKIQWLIHQDSALFSIAMMAAWMNIGYNMVIFLAGLQNIPRPLYEAARVDGCTGIKAFWYITLPMLAPTTFFVVTTTLISAFQVFTEPYVMGGNNGRGPANSTITGVVYLYNSGFVSNHMGYASAIAWILVIIIFFLTLFQFRISERYTNIG